VSGELNLPQVNAIFRQRKKGKKGIYENQNFDRSAGFATSFKFVFDTAAAAGVSQSGQHGAGH
jgi:hypothetical protein